MPDPTTVLTAAALATAAPSPSTLWMPPATPYTLALGSEDGSADSELAELERRMNRAHALFAAGGTGMVVGGVATAAGASLAIFGVLSCIDECNDGLMATGAGIAIAGASTVALSVPVFVTATFLGTEGLRAQGIHVSRVPTWIMLGGLGVVGAGALVEEPSLLTVGAGAFLGGGVAQVIHTRSAFRKVRGDEGVRSPGHGPAPLVARRRCGPEPRGPTLTRLAREQSETDGPLTAPPFAGS